MAEIYRLTDCSTAPSVRFLPLDKLGRIFDSKDRSTLTDISHVIFTISTIVQNHPVF